MKSNTRITILCFMVVLFGLFSTSVVMAEESGGGQVSTKSGITFFQEKVEPKPTPIPKPVPTPEPDKKPSPLPQTSEAPKINRIWGILMITVVGLLFSYKRNRGCTDENE